MRKLANLGAPSPNVPADKWYNQHHRGSGTASKTDGKEQVENEIDRQVADHAIAQHEAANKMANHGLPKK